MAITREEIDLLIKMAVEGEQNIEGAFDGISSAQAVLEANTKRLRSEMQKLAQDMEAGLVPVEEGTEQYKKLQRELNDTEKDLDSLSETTEKNSTRFTELASKLDMAKQAFGFVQQGAQLAFDALQRGAEVQQTASTFDSLTASIGTTADVMLGALRTATSGMVTDFDLMQSANRFMAMGLAATADEAAELSKVATTLGAAMGVGPTQAMEDFALLLANQSIPRLDTFGISSGRVRERINELTSGVNGLDRETAFLQATMEEAEKTMVAVGGEVDELTKGMAQLEVAQKNLVDRGSAGFSQKMAPSVIGLSNVVTAYSKAQADANRAVELGIIKTADITRIVDGAGLGFERSKEELRQLREELEEYDNALATANESTEESDRILTRTSSSFEDVAEAVGETTEAIERSTASGDTYAKRGQEMAEVSDKLTNSIRFQKEQLEAAAKAVDDSYIKAFEDALPLVDDYIQAQDDMNAASGEWVEVTRDNSAEIASINAQLFSDLDSDQKSAMTDLVSTAEEGGTEWLAAFDGLQGDLTESQRNALVARRSELEASQGDIASVYTGDAEAFEAAQQRKLEAEAAFTAQLQENAFAIAEARIIAEGGDVIANTEQLLDLAVAQGIKTQEQADLQLLQTENTLQTQEVTQALMDIYLEDGVLAQEESARLATAVTLIGDNADLTTEQLVSLGLAGTEHAGLVTSSFEDTNTAVIDASGSVDTLAVKIGALPDEVTITVRINTIGEVPAGLGNGTTSEVMEEAGVN